MELKQATSDKTSDKSKRLIYAEDLKSTLLDLEAQGGHKYYRQGANTILHEIMPQIIDDCPTVDAAEVIRGQWIPVTERLPEHCVTVLSYDGRDYRTVKTDSYDHCFECWLSDMGDILDRNTVTHWMPLPECPKENYL